MRLHVRLAAVLLGGLAACATQRSPAPMGVAQWPLPPGDVPSHPPGPQEVTVFRHSDPVMVRRSGEPGGFPLPFYSKKERVMSGAWVLTAAGGRCELLWPGDASSVVVFDECVVVVGEPSREEPMITFRKLSRARLILTPEDRVELMGGAILRGDTEEASGPFLVERRLSDLLRIVNQSKRTCTLEYLEEELVISPSEYVDVPLLPGGAAPEVRDPREEILRRDHGELVVLGPVFEEDDPDPAEDGSAGPADVHLRAEGQGSVRTLGVRVTLGEGEGLVIDGLGEPREVVEDALDPEIPGETPEDTPGDSSGPEVDDDPAGEDPSEEGASGPM